MNSPRTLLIAAAWLATIVIGFSLGQMTSPAKQSSGKAAAGTGAAQEGPLAAAGNPNSPSTTDDSLLAEWFGSRARDLSDVIGAKSLADHVKHLLAQDDEATRMLGFLRLLEALNSGDDLKAALDVIGRDSNGRFRMTEQSMLLQKWAKLEPKAAATYAAGLRDFSRFNGLNAVLRTWVKANSEEAIAWAVENGVQPGNQPQNARGPGGGGDDGNWAVAMLVGPLAKTNLERALEVASEQPYSRARGRMVDSLVNELISQRGEEAARHAVLDLGDDPFRAGLAGRLAEQMAEKDPQGAASWANGLPAGETRERAVAEVISEWADRDPAAAGNHLKQLGNSPEYDRARQEYAERVVRNDPEGALAWAAAINDQDRRASTVRDLLGSWLRRDPTVATAWAQANGVQLPAANSGFRGFRGRGGPGGR